jgi:hypothetical protein
VTSLLGAPLIPCLFLVLGANLAEGPGAAQVRHQHSHMSHRKTLTLGTCVQPYNGMNQLEAPTLCTTCAQHQCTLGVCTSSDLPGAGGKPG